jgi:hypothetical protein
VTAGFGIVVLAFKGDCSLPGRQEAFTRLFPMINVVAA